MELRTILFLPRVAPIVIVLMSIAGTSRGQTSAPRPLAAGILMGDSLGDTTEPGTKTHLLRRSMADLERDLECSHFCRIHRSTIVNLLRLQDLCLDSSGEYEAVVRDGTRLKVSRGYREKLQTSLQGMAAREALVRD
jgi:hypothetical protein